LNLNYARRDSNDPIKTQKKHENDLDASRHTAHFSPELQRLIDAWPTLPEAVRANILAMIDMAGNG
jgi:hypothetical protein